MKRIVSLLLIPTSWAFSHQHLTVDPHQRLKASISSHFYNRLSMEGESIAQVFANGDVTFEQDEIQGQVFIKPLQADHPIYISVVMEKGMTQDLTLVPNKKEPQTILLKKSDKKQRPSGHTYPEILKHALQAVREGQHLEGFVKTDQKPKRPFSTVAVEEATLYQGTGLSLEIYKVVNTTNETVRLSEETIDPKGIKALFVSRTTLTPSQKAHVIILSQKEETL